MRFSPLQNSEILSATTPISRNTIINYQFWASASVKKTPTWSLSLPENFDGTFNFVSLCPEQFDLSLFVKGDVIDVHYVIQSQRRPIVDRGRLNRRVCTFGLARGPMCTKVVLGVCRNLLRRQFFSTERLSLAFLAFSCPARLAMPVGLGFNPYSAYLPVSVLIFYTVSGKVFSGFLSRWAMSRCRKWYGINGHYAWL